MNLQPLQGFVAGPPQASRPARLSMIPCMASPVPSSQPARDAARTAALPRLLAPLLRWLRGWLQLLVTGLVLLVLLCERRSHGRAQRQALALQLWRDVMPAAIGFTVLCALGSLVLIRIVIVTAVSYGLTRYALEALVRVLVIELIPLFAALFVALRCTIPDGAELSALRRAGRLRDGVDDIEPLRRELLPRFEAGVIGVVLLAAINVGLGLLLSYLMVYGFTSAGLPAFSRVVGQIFSPDLMLVFALKTLGFGVAVSLIPLASGFLGRGAQGGAHSRTPSELHALVRMFIVLLLVEAASLAFNYG